MKEEVNDKVETYPADPRPVTVEVITFILVPPGPNAVEKGEKLWLMKLVVEIKEDVKDKLEIYPDEPRPVTVDVNCDVK